MTYGLGGRLLGLVVECRVADRERFLGAGQHFVEQQHFFLRPATAGGASGSEVLVGDAGEEAVVGVGGELAGALGRGERLLRHAGEVEVPGRDRAGRGGGQHADAAGVVVRAGQRFVAGQIDEPVEQVAAA